MEEHCQQFITIQSANLDTLISYSNQILKENPVTTDNARHDQSPITKSTSQTDSFYDEDIKSESQIELPAKPKMIKIKKKRNKTPKFKNESLIVKELVPNGISSHKMEIVEDFVINPFVDGQQSTEASQYMNMDIDTLNQMEELPDYGNGIGIEDEIGNGNEIAKDHVIEINNGIDEIGIDNEIEAWYELKRQKDARQKGSKPKKQNTTESKKETKIESIEGTRDHNSQNKINQITLAESELHKLNELINLPAPDFKNIGEVEKWFEAKRIMLQNLIPRFKK